MNIFSLVSITEDRLEEVESELKAEKESPIKVESNLTSLEFEVNYNKNVLRFLKGIIKDLK